MISTFLADLLGGATFFAIAIFSGYFLFRLARRRPESILVGSSMFADMVCVAEVIMLVGGIGLMLRAFFDLV